MKSLTYLAVFEPCGDGAYSVFFPDVLGCISYGKTLDEARRMATEAISLHIYGMECDGDAIPEATGVIPEEYIEGNVISPVTCYPDLFRMEMEKERVKTNTTLPRWLKRIAEENKINYSRLLEAAIIDYLQLPSQTTI